MAQTPQNVRDVFQSRPISLCFFLILLIATMITRPTMDRLSPETRVKVAHHFEFRSDPLTYFYVTNVAQPYGSGRDPWGSSWSRVITRSSVQSDPRKTILRTVYSRGPNRLDERGLGDDITVYKHGEANSPEIADFVYIWGPVLFFALAMFVFCVRFALRFLLIAKTTRLGEIVRAAELAIPISTVICVPMILACFSLSLWPMTIYSFVEYVQTLVPVYLHPFIVMALASYILCFAFILHFRLAPKLENYSDSPAQTSFW